MKNLSAEQMEKSPAMEWVKKSLFKDDSIVEKANKQSFFDISYVKEGCNYNTGIWAIDLKEATNKAFLKYWGCTNIQVIPYNFIKNNQN